MYKHKLRDGTVVTVDDKNKYLFDNYSWHIKDGYVLRRIEYVGTNGKRKSRYCRLHREIMNPPKGFFVDHINRDKLDNREANLRICTPKQNIWNSSPRGGVSCYRGVCWAKRPPKWYAQIMHNGVLKSIGYFDMEINAALAYDRMAIKLRGEFAGTNFLNPKRGKHCTLQ